MSFGQHGILVVLLLFFCQAGLGRKAFDDYKKENQVPEPLFVDLVRSLDAEQGEWEVNSLFYQRQQGFSEFNWAPEIEFVAQDGLAFEFELPMRGDQLETYKIAGQQRLYRSPSGAHLQGLQLIYEAETDFQSSQGTLYYIVAHRFNHALSVIGLYGIKSTVERFSGLEASLNQSFFYNYSQEIDFGLEINYLSGELSPGYLQAVPQLHLAFREGAKFQFGFGSRFYRDLATPVSTFRLIWEFNES